MYPCRDYQRESCRPDATIRVSQTAHLIAELLAAAIGAGIPIGSGQHGDLGWNLRSGDLERYRVSSSVRAAGNKIDDMITSYVKKRYNLLIGERTEGVKIRIGSVPERAAGDGCQGATRSPGS